MPLPNSAPISFSQLKTEFGQIGNPDFSEYYRGGLLVTGTSVNSSIPLSGTMNLSDFYGSAEFMKLDPSTTTIVLSAVNVVGGPGLTKIDIHTSGTIIYTLGSGSGGSESGTGHNYWGTPTNSVASGALYEVRATLDSVNGIQIIGANVIYTLLGETPTGNGYQTAWYPMTSVKTISGRGNNGDSTVEMAGILEFRKIYSTLTTTATLFSIYAESLINI